MNPNYNDGRCCYCGVDDPTCEERCVLRCEVAQTDCIIHMKGMGAQSVDLICTSPPYKANKSYESWESFEDYEDFADQWIEQAARVLTPTGTMMLNVGYTKIARNETLPLTYLYHRIATKHGLKLVQEITWRYYGGMSYKLRYTHRTERIMWLTKDPNNCTFNLDDVREKRWILNGEIVDTLPKGSNWARCNPLGKNPTDVWEIRRVANGGKNHYLIHPAQFPPLMIERIIKAHSNEGDLVFDPFLGTGTTCVIAKQLKRNSIGCELIDEYIDVCKERGVEVKA